MDFLQWNNRIRIRGENITDFMTDPRRFSRFNDDFFVRMRRQPLQLEL